MRQSFIKSFGFSKREISGILALLSLIVLLFAFSYLADVFLGSRNLTESEVVAYHEIAVEMNGNDRLSTPSVVKSPLRSFTNTQLEPFDPNVLDLKGWMNFGLSEKQSQTILNYLSKGGRFRKPEDLQKMYVIGEELFERLGPYISIANNEVVQKYSYPDQATQYKSEAIEVVNINLADSIALLKVKGIGPVFARRILAYRNRIGGYANAGQLLEVFGFDSLRLSSVNSNFIFGTDLTLIHINTITFDALRRHPYLNYNQAQSIIQYRNQHGSYHSLEDLEKVKTLDRETLRKLSPYLMYTDDRTSN